MNVWYCLGCNAPLKPKNYYCGSCRKMLSAYSRHKSFPYVKEMVKLVDKLVPKAWLNEYERRTHLPYKVNGQYAIGRRGENGRIQEKATDLHV